MSKSDLNKFAIFSGKPAFEQHLHVGRPNIGNRDRLNERFNEMLDRRWFTNNGPFVQEFERKIAAYTGAKHCIAACNATIALEITIRALGLKGEVIVPSFTFIATAHALQFQEITPTFCDVGHNSHNIDPSRIEALITPRTTGIIGVHVWGEVCDVEAITEIAKRHNLRVIFDAAHALGCSHDGKMVGSFGDAEVFSFHATKFLNSFEGGAITTNNDELAEKLRYMRNFGFAGYDDVEYIGTNGKMTEVCALMGLTSLEEIDELISTNRRNYDCYKACLQDVPGIKLFPYSDIEKRNYQYIIAEIDVEKTGISRDDLVKVLHAENVLVRRYFYPGCHQMEPYRSYFPHAGLLLPTTEELTLRVMSLPNGTQVQTQDIEHICDIISQAIQNGHEITDSLKEKMIS